MYRALTGMARRRLPSARGCNTFFVERVNFSDQLIVQQLFQTIFMAFLEERSVGGRNQTHRLISAHLFGQIQSTIGQAENFIYGKIQGGWNPRKRGPSNRARALEANPVADIELLSVDRLQNSGRYNLAVSAFRRSADDQKFFASPTDQEIRLAHDAIEPLRDLHQHAIASVVPVLVVHTLEMVDVYQQKNQIAPIDCPARDT